MSAELKLGDRFSVTEVREAIRKTDGRHLARYLPEHTYTYTSTNKEYVDAFNQAGVVVRVEAGRASPGGRGIALTPTSAKVRGSINTGETK